MKIKLGNIDPAAVITTRGVVYVRDTRWGAIAQAWPRKRGKAKTPYDVYRQTEFKMVAAALKLSDPIAFQTAINLAKGSEQVPRDLLTAAAYGTLYDLVDPTGKEWISGTMTQPNPQYILDLINTTPGIILYRDDEGWFALMPGAAGQVLTMQDGLPVWANAGASPDTGNLNSFIWSPANRGIENSQSTASFGYAIQPTADMTITALSAYMNLAATATYRLGVAPFNRTTRQLIELPFYTATITSSATINEVPIVAPLTTPQSLDAGTDYLLILTRTDGLATTGAKIRTTTTFTPAPCFICTISNRSYRVANLDPQTSTTWTDEGANAVNCFGLLGYLNP